MTRPRGSGEKFNLLYQRLEKAIERREKLKFLSEIYSKGGVVVEVEKEDDPSPLPPVEAIKLPELNHKDKQNEMPKSLRGYSRFELLRMYTDGELNEEEEKFLNSRRLFWEAHIEPRWL